MTKEEIRNLSDDVLLKKTKEATMFSYFIAAVFIVVASIYIYNAVSRTEGFITFPSILLFIFFITLSQRKKDLEYEVKRRKLR